MQYRKIFGASGDAPSSFSQPALAGFVFLDTDLKTRRRTRDEKVGGRGSCRAKLSANRQVGKSASRETAANSDWRMLKQQRVANGE
jgi:hypothetical protein